MANDYYQQIFNTYLKESPGAKEKIDHWFKHNTHSIRIFYKDGTQGVFHQLTRGLRSIDRKTKTKANWNREFKEELWELMYDRGYTQQTLAKAVGISQKALSKYMTKESIPSAYIIFKLAEALKCTPNDLIWFFHDED